ncbi:putative Serine/threonine protein kinase [uncultured Desulfobacterium sp.]|uniref:non-specific serine/threonine protein kinase n=1 Tax=uncultured Desulfobacterium sp. TaxID=201089 RepID=A0A445MVQ5_9BACT|nr:putative Serine/threonine protein kinase [uncultured Desulfobacterium sp.]
MNLGRYRIVKEVGKGSMGVVYQAHDPQIDRLVALKVLRRDRVEGESFVKRFLKEARVIGRFSHPNIVTVYDIGQDREDVYIAMEFVEGEPLNQVIRQKRFPLEQAIQLGIQAAQVLDYAHQKGVVHRDIKPSNIILQPNGQIKITDFGIAHMEDSSSTLLTLEGEIMGTPAYMSPEQVLGKPVDGRTDIFSLGVVLYELASGKRPFGGEGKNIATVFNEIIHHSPGEPAFETDLIPKGLSQVVMKCLNKSPEERFQTGMELSAALTNCLKVEGESVVKPSSGKKPQKYAALLLAALVIVIGGGAYYYFFEYQGRMPKEQSPPVAITPQAEAPGPITSIPPAEVPKEMEKTPEETPKQETVEEVATPQPEPPVAITTTPPVEAPEDTVKADEEKQVEMGGKSEEQPTGEDRANQQAALPEKQAPVPVKPARESVALKPAVKRACLKVLSTPLGADIIVDDKTKGKTPATIKLSPGTYKITLKLSDYQTWNTQVTLDKEDVYPIHAELKPIPKNGEWIIKPLTDRKKEEP